MSDTDNIFSDYMSDDIKENDDVSLLTGEIQTELFTELVNDRTKKDTSDSSSEGKTPEEKNPVDPEYIELKNKSSHAQLYKHIQVEELNHLKIENERVNFLKNAGKVAEFSFMDFLYIGFMEKCVLDFLKMSKKLKHRYGSFLSEEHLDKVIQMLNSEISYVIKGVKDKQKEELENWKDGLH